MSSGGSGNDEGDRGSLVPGPPASTMSMIMMPVAAPTKTLGRYELLVPIAEGGMASVWAARMKGQRGFQKIVAIKQMRPELCDDPNFETMFLDEAALVSRLKHPNLAEIFDLGEEEGHLYQVMEYVDGEPLNRVLRQKRGPLPIPLAVLIGKQACAALHMAHELRDENGNLVGLVHRDISLQNILVSQEGVTKVIDFGVAKAMSNQQKTSIGQVKGKVPYMSPEQAIGDPVDRRTDIFALGIVLYQLVTGKHPFRGETELETMMHICDKKPVVPASKLLPSIPPALDAVLMKALAKDKNDRYSTTTEMLRELEMALPPGEHATGDDLSQFMRTLLGARAEQRRLAIQEAGRLADAGSANSERRPGTVPPSARLTTSSITSARPPSSAPESSIASSRSSGVANPSSIPPPGSSSTMPPSNPALKSTPSGKPAPPVPPKRTWKTALAGSTRTILIIAVMGSAGIGIGLGVMSALTPTAEGPGLAAVDTLYPALRRARSVALAISSAKATVAAPTSTASGSPSATPSTSASAKKPRKPKRMF